ncbi:MAG: T9SS type A sorting domain-containing protein, partial [Cyclobacteriaceae bacterium]|nr:T9SS type A sorting domain-containing protein [Cyclobacteriaceae bacterium]
GLIRTQIRTADNQPFVEIIAFRSTDENGEFDFRGLPPEDYVVLVDIPGVPLSDNLNEYLIRIPEIANDREYEVNVEIEAGPQGIIFRVNLPLSIVEGINDLQLYPNPTSSQLRLRSHSNLHQYNRYEIFDLRGMKRQSGSFNAYYAELGVGGLAEGVYFLRLVGEGATSKPYKFIKGN